MGGKVIAKAERSARHLYEEIKDLIDANQEILIFGHKDADGDTLGCSLAFAEALRAAGKDVWVLIPPPLPDIYAFLPGFQEIQVQPPHGVDPRLAFFFDSGNLERSGASVKQIGGVLHEIEVVGLSHRRRHLPDEISVGERQRSAIARALAVRPKVLFADEPTGSLDSHRGETVLTLLRSAATQGCAVLMVTHDLGAAARADRVLRICDGRIETPSPASAAAC